jgi:hypothetical protein
VEILAACHLHSGWSYDGSWTLEALADAFGQRGYRALLMTEHDKGFTASRWSEYRDACVRASTDRVRVVPGMEYSDADNRVHVLVWGPVPFLGEGLPTEDVLRRAAQHGGLAVLAHPARRTAWERFTPDWLPYLLGIEVWNRKYDGWAPGEPGAGLLKGATQVPFVGLDFHSRRQMFPLGMAVDVGGTIDEAAIVQSLRQKRCAARAFGLPLDEHRFEKRLPLLRLAERSRRKLVTLKRYSKSRVSR